jgi:L-threonylcarbamoyladenylate synthase
MNWSNEQDLLAQMAAASLQTKDCHIIAHTHVPMSEAFARVCIIPHDAEAFGRAIYSELHRCDAEGARLIIIEQLPDTPAWSGITDRLQRAAAL